MDVTFTMVDNTLTRQNSLHQSAEYRVEWLISVLKDYEDVINRAHKDKEILRGKMNRAAEELRCAEEQYLSYKKNSQNLDNSNITDSRLSIALKNKNEAETKCEIASAAYQQALIQDANNIDELLRIRNNLVTLRQFTEAEYKRAYDEHKRAYEEAVNESQRAYEEAVNEFKEYELAVDNCNKKIIEYSTKYDQISKDLNNAEKVLKQAAANIEQCNNDLIMSGTAMLYLSASLSFIAMLYL